MVVVIIVISSIVVNVVVWVGLSSGSWFLFSVELLVWGGVQSEARGSLFAGETRAGQVFPIGDVVVIIVCLLVLLCGGSKDLGIINIAHIGHMSFKSSWVLYLRAGRGVERREVACFVRCRLLFDDG